MSRLLGRLFGRGRTETPRPRGGILGFLAGEYQTVSSSNVLAAQYHAADQKLMVEFRNGSAYLYSPVSQATAAAFISAGSKGEFVWSHFRVRGKGGDAKPAPGITVVKIR